MADSSNNDLLERTVKDLKRTSGLDSRWFQEDKTTEDKAKTEKILRNSTVIVRLLKKILEEEFASHVFKQSDLDKPNLDKRLVYKEGYQAALQTIYRTLP